MGGGLKGSAGPGTSTDAPDPAPHRSSATAAPRSPDPAPTLASAPAPAAAPSIVVAKRSARPARLSHEHTRTGAKVKAPRRRTSGCSPRLMRHAGGCAGIATDCRRGRRSVPQINVVIIDYILINNGARQPVAVAQEQRGLTVCNRGGVRHYSHRLHSTRLEHDAFVRGCEGLHYRRLVVRENCSTESHACGRRSTVHHAPAHGRGDGHVLQEAHQIVRVPAHNGRLPRVCHLSPPGSVPMPAAWARM